MSIPILRPDKAPKKVQGNYFSANSAPLSRETTSEATPSATPPFKTWFWLVLPAIAVTAYATVLRIGFLADDLIFLQANKQGLIDARIFLPQHGTFFYRPIGELLTWKLNGGAWGLNPVPYHLQGLLLHAAVSLALGLWLSEVSNKPILGWLAGAIFAVFPAHLEAVGWLSAQWDMQATLFGLVSAWLVTLWWKHKATNGKGRWYLLLAAVLLYGLGLFSKESLFTFIPIIGVSAWAARPPQSLHAWRALLLALLPFCAVAGFNIILRLLRWGNIGNYVGIRTDYANFFWNSFINQLNILLSPINPAVFNKATSQIVGATTSILLLTGLVFHARKMPRVVVLAIAWLVFTLIPVLNLLVNTEDLQQNRFLYLPSVGYSILVATIIYAGVSSLKRQRMRNVSAVAVGGLLTISIIACWVQLRPWHTTTVMARDIDAQTRTLIPPQKDRPGGMLWYVENAPDTYKGAYLYRLGMGAMRDFTTGGDGTWLENVPNAVEAPVIKTASQQDVYAMSFRYDEHITNFRIDYLFGVTHSTPPPGENSPDVGHNLRVWDFSNCKSDVLKEWQPHEARYSCIDGQGLLFQGQSSDSQLIGPDMPPVAPNNRAGFIRLRIAVSYPSSSTSAAGSANQWYWLAPGQGFSDERSRTQLVLQDDKYHIYWTYLPRDAVLQGLSKLRFDPINSNVPHLKIKWIAMDAVD